MKNKLLSILTYGLDNNVLSISEYNQFDELSFNYQISLLKEIILSLVKEIREMEINHNKKARLKMIYNIITTKDYASNQELELIKSGNKYLITLYDIDTNRSGHILLDSIDQAMIIYKKFIDFIIRGYFSFEQRKNILESEEK